MRLLDEKSMIDNWLDEMKVAYDKFGVNYDLFEDGAKAYINDGVHVRWDKALFAETKECFQDCEHLYTYHLSSQFVEAYFVSFKQDDLVYRILLEIEEEAFRIEFGHKTESEEAFSSDFLGFESKLRLNVNTKFDHVRSCLLKRCPDYKEVD